MNAPLPKDETARLEVLRKYQILDTEAEQAFDDLTYLAAHICGTPIALISLVDECRQWFKSKVGLDAIETPRDVAFCAYAIWQPDVLIVPDTLLDERFATNPLVTSNPKIRFYAGVPLIAPQGHALGTLCVIDRVPRQLNDEQVKALQALARSAIAQFELRRSLAEMKRTEEELQRQNLRSQLFADLTLKIRQSLQLKEILQNTVTEVQKFLQTDRVLLFRLWPDGSGTVVEESVVADWPVTIGKTLIDTCFIENYIEKYRQGRISAIADINHADLQPCHVQFLQQFEVKANLVVPILNKDELWGLLIAHQCAQPRNWSSFELELLQHLANQIAIALAQAQLLEQETNQSQELARSNSELQQFAYIASHDLQEPLRKIQAFGNLLKNVCGEALSDRGRDYLERMQNAAGRMQTLIEDLLVLSRVTTNAQPFVAINLTQVVKEVLEDLEIGIQQHDGRVEVGELPTIDADPIQMRQLFQNLIANALKFHKDQQPSLIKIYSQIASREQQLSVGIAPEQPECQIIVEDNGIGFDEKYLDRIFNVFQRLHGRSQYQGTGVGLAICRKIADRHNGTITATSSPGIGAKFIVTLPTKQLQS